MNNGVNNFSAERVAVLRQNIDLTEIPEIKDFSKGYLRNGPQPNKVISLRIDIDNLTWLKSKGVGYQQRLNNALRWAREHNCPLG